MLLKAMLIFTLFGSLLAIYYRQTDLAQWFLLLGIFWKIERRVV